MLVPQTNCLTMAAPGPPRGEGPTVLASAPDECIDCAVCIPECPVNAIYAEEDLPPGHEEFTALNAELAKVWPTISDKKDPLPDADEGKDVKANGGRHGT